MSTTDQTVQVVLPELGESVTEGVVVEWRKAVGEAVSEGETLLDVTTDKVDVEIPAPAAGVLLSIAAGPGAAVEVGALLGEIGPGGGAPPAPAPAAGNGAAGNGAPAAPAAPPATGGALVAIQLPDMESVTEGTVVEWRKQVGQAVAADEIVVEVSTDKVDLEVPSPAAGVLESTAFAAGETFPVAEALGQIRAGATASADGAPAAAAPAAPAAAAAPSAPVRDVPATPVARRLAHEAGVDLLEVTGTGPGGLIRKGDVREAIANPKPAAPPAPAGEEAVTLRGPAAALAEYMDESRSIPTATTFRTLPVAILDAERKRLNGALAAGGGGKLSFTHLIAWAIVQAVGRTPSMGTGFQRVDGTPQKLVRDAVHLGIAVDVERKDGSRSLLVPVIREADRLGFAGFRAAFDDLIERSRTGKIKPDELRGASVTLTNPGGFGTVASVPRLMNGQGTIVATGSIGYPPGLDSVPEGLLREWGVTKVMTMTSTYDHRVIQGAESGAFLRDIAMLLQGQDGFYDEVRASLGLGAEAPLAQPQPTTTPAATPAPAPVVADEEMLRTVAAAVSLVRAYRTHGHLAARLDPLGSAPEGDPALDPSWVGLTHDALAKVPASILDVDLPQVTTAADALTRLREVYCGAIAYEFAHISDHEQRAWLRQEIESGHIREPLPPERKRALLERLISVETFERFLRRTYLGQKTFSLEGCDVLVPVLDESLELLADGGAQEVIIGMAHRGRLAAMTHTVNRPFESILAEFEGVVETGPQDESGEDPYAAAGDVKYHLGAEGTYVSRGGRPVQVTLAANPSHLEQVDAVAEGRTRARQTLRTGRQAHHDPTRAVAVLVHGDAAFPGQGVVAETLNLQALTGYTTGGTIHVIANNQVGFTTDPEDSRSTRYASDLAKGFDMPIVHVNADDVEANIAAVRLSAAFRRRFGQDVLIDIIGYRRLGHNELDEPAYTQPVMARTIKNHPTVARVYATQLISEGVIDEAGFNAMVEAAEQRMGAAHKAVVSGLEQGSDQDGAAVKRRRSRSRQVRTHVSEGTLRSLNEQLHTVPDGVTIHPKLLPQLERRRQGLDQEQGITWAHAESLAFASLLIEGVPVRLTGQDVARGTFSQRHLELHDIAEGESYKARKGRTHIPMQTLLRAKASFEIHNSPLSESATVGFEYGYSTQAPETLVIWEAQYGDFANGAQIMIDQFIAAGEAKWGVQSRLTLLLPHGYEGNGPEHSSARVERFLRLGAEDNIRIANCSTAANYFHLLRRQGLSDELRPLVVFTPKSLLRAKSASSTLADLAHGTFQPLLEDPRAAGRREEIRRMILCTGKIFHELDAHPDREAQTDLAVTRVEGLYPFPKEEFLELLEHYPNLEAVTWAQEEPRNMGAWSFVTRRVTGLLPRGMVLGYIGRPVRASPSEGYPQTHQVEQQRVLREALVGIVMAGSW